MAFRLYDFPVIFLVVVLAVLVAAALLGRWFKRGRELGDDEQQEFTFVISSALTLLALVVGFSFSMAVGRYDLRKTDEANEANAIGTEYLRVGLLDGPDTVLLRALLKNYADLRVAWYTSRNEEEATAIGVRQHDVEARMWSVVDRAAVASPTPVRALVAAGMNEVIDNTGYTEAAWLNRIPRAAWILMYGIAICCCFLLGYASKESMLRLRAVFVLPALFAVSLFLIADLDSTRHGLIAVAPENLRAVAQSLASARP